MEDLQAVAAEGEDLPFQVEVEEEVVVVVAWSLGNVGYDLGGFEEWFS